MKCFRLIVSGRVQGVNFRNGVRKFCLMKGIKGTVQNLSDGNVEIFAQCDKNIYEDLIKWLKSNPGFAKVENVGTKEISCEENFGDFEIVREGRFFDDQKGSIKNLTRRILKI